MVRGLYCTGPEAWIISGQDAPGERLRAAFAFIECSVTKIKVIPDESGDVKASREIITVGMDPLQAPWLQFFFLLRPAGRLTIPAMQA